MTFELAVNNYTELERTEYRICRIKNLLNALIKNAGGEKRLLSKDERRLAKSYKNDISSLERDIEKIKKRGNK